MITRTIVKVTVEWSKLVKSDSGVELQTNLVDLFFTHEPTEEEIERKLHKVTGERNFIISNIDVFVSRREMDEKVFYTNSIQKEGK